MQPLLDDAAVSADARLTIDDGGALASTIAAFLAGGRSLSGLELYYQRSSSGSDDDPLNR